MTTLCFEEGRTSLPGGTTGGSGNLGTPRIKENARSCSDSLDARPSDNNLPFQFTSFAFLAQYFPAPERLTFFELQRRDDEELAALFMVVLHAK